MDNKFRFSNKKLYYSISNNLVLVMEASKNKKYLLSDVWDYTTLYSLDVGASFEDFNHKNANEVGGYFFKESDIEDIFRLIKSESPW
ncbi:hypothetical protein [Paenibacillus sp. FSL M7-0420]|uniref:hypothetical protein n=1 Tax=Paenibacillus sp. FSL M7-0420 TaxID=2921609 RepID=UPI0030F5B54C